MAWLSPRELCKPVTCNWRFSSNFQHLCMAILYILLLCQCEHFCLHLDLEHLAPVGQARSIFRPVLERFGLYSVIFFKTFTNFGYLFLKSCPMILSWMSFNSSWPSCPLSWQHVLTASSFPVSLMIYLCIYYFIFPLLPGLLFWLLSRVSSPRSPFNCHHLNSLHTDLLHLKQSFPLWYFIKWFCRVD